MVSLPRSTSFQVSGATIGKIWTNAGATKRQVLLVNVEIISQSKLAAKDGIRSSDKPFRGLGTNYPLSNPT